MTSPGRVATPVTDIKPILIGRATCKQTRLVHYKVGCNGFVVLLHLRSNSDYGAWLFKPLKLRYCVVNTGTPLTFQGTLTFSGNRAKDVGNTAADNQDLFGTGDNLEETFITTSVRMLGILGVGTTPLTLCSPTW